MERRLAEVSLDEWDTRARRERKFPSQEDRFAAYYLRWEAPFWWGEMEEGEEEVLWG